MVNQLKRFMKEEEGATAIEYGLLAALIAAVIVATVQALGTTVNTAFGIVDAGISGT
jgi:pilus assembly protein Flp/PilA